MAGWRIRPSPSSRRPSSPAIARLVGLVAHELAHSWSGNLVTNAVWRDSWLNEGVTSYFENRIMEALYGPARAGQEAALSWADMEAALRELGADAPGTRLHGDDDPDGGSSGIVYDKGAIFLRTIERIVGRDRAGTPICAPISTATPSSR